MAALHRGPGLGQHLSYGSNSSSRSSTPSFGDSDNNDMISPCPVQKTGDEQQPESQRTHTERDDAPQQRSNQPHIKRPNSRREETWHFDPLDGEGHDSDTAALWQTMLSIQREFGCYNSARMRAAIELGDEHVAVPSKMCLDLLNDGVSELPEEARRQLDGFLNSESGSRGRRSSSRRRSSASWTRRLLQGLA